MIREVLIFTLWEIIYSVIIEGKGFDYTRSDQLTWAERFPFCGGMWQSPIVIAAKRSIGLPLPALEMVGYHDFLELPLYMKNNGHTVSLQVKHEFSRRRSPYIFGALLNENEDYELESFHFHWGLRNSKGSEHVLHGTRYPMEMHLIHRNMKYQNLETALQHKDGLAVLGIFFHLEEDDNELLPPLINHLQEIQWINTESKLNHSFILASILPRHMDTYYTYRGSLTTPPCNEVVTWIIFAHTVPISFKQMSKFRFLSDGKSILADNYRYLQDIGKRKVYVRRTNDVFMSENEINNLDISTLTWEWE